MSKTPGREPQPHHPENSELVGDIVAADSQVGEAASGEALLITNSTTGRQIVARPAGGWRLGEPRPAPIAQESAAAQAQASGVASPAGLRTVRVVLPGAPESPQDTTDDAAAEENRPQPSGPGATGKPKGGRRGGSPASRTTTQREGGAASAGRRVNKNSGASGPNRKTPSTTGAAGKSGAARKPQKRTANVSTKSTASGNVADTSAPGPTNHAEDPADAAWKRMATEESGGAEKRAATEPRVTGDDEALATPDHAAEESTPDVHLADVPPAAAAGAPSASAAAGSAPSTAETGTAAGKPPIDPSYIERFERIQRGLDERLHSDPDEAREGAQRLLGSLPPEAQEMYTNWSTQQVAAEAAASRTAAPAATATTATAESPATGEDGVSSPDPSTIPRDPVERAAFDAILEAKEDSAARMHNLLGSSAAQARFKAYVAARGVTSPITGDTAGDDRSGAAPAVDPGDAAAPAAAAPGTLVPDTAGSAAPDASAASPDVHALTPDEFMKLSQDEQFELLYECDAAGKPAFGLYALLSSQAQADYLAYDKSRASREAAAAAGATTAPPVPPVTSAPARRSAINALPSMSNLPSMSGGSGARVSLADYLLSRGATPTGPSRAAAPSPASVRPEKSWRRRTAIAAGVGTVALIGVVGAYLGSKHGHDASAVAAHMHEAARHGGHVVRHHIGRLGLHHLGKHEHLSSGATPTPTPGHEATAQPAPPTLPGHEYVGNGAGEAPHAARHIVERLKRPGDTVWKLVADHYHNLHGHRLWLKVRDVLHANHLTWKTARDMQVGQKVDLGTVAHGHQAVHAATHAAAQHIPHAPAEQATEVVAGVPTPEAASVGATAVGPYAVVPAVILSSSSNALTQPQPVESIAQAGVRARSALYALLRQHVERAQLELEEEAEDKKRKKTAA